MKQLFIISASVLVVLALYPLLDSRSGNAPPTDGVTHIAVEFSGGYQTNPVDRGRPVVLIAGALGVPDEVFREAFSHVRPAPGGQHPTQEREQMNKQALMSRLGQHGITNDRLDEVSNYYRYRPQNGERWPTDNAKAYALVQDGVITVFDITHGGSGYSSSPRVRVAGYEAVSFSIQLSYTADFRQNGSIDSISTQ
jgi:hypothetical protein